MRNILAALTITALFFCNYVVAQEEPSKVLPKLFKEENIEKYKVVEKPTILVIGIECKTSNAPEAAPNDIPNHWEKFYSENIMNQIPHKTSTEVIAFFCDYEGDYTKPYSLFIGCAVDSIDNIPLGMVFKAIPAGSYAVFHATGEHPKALTDTWEYILEKADLKRTYNVDYEVYGKKFFSADPQEVEVYIALEK